jgi:putative transposase
MVRYRRNLVPGGTFFFTLTLADRCSAYLVENIGALRSAFRAVRESRPFQIDAIVILPEHLHAIMTLPPGDSEYSGRWRLIKSTFTHEVAALAALERDLRGAYSLRQRRFWEHTIRDDADLEQHVDYVHFNPVKHGLVSRVVDWPYSSFHRYVRQGLLPEDWAGTAEKTGARFGEPPP